MKHVLICIGLFCVTFYQNNVIAQTWNLSGNTNVTSNNNNIIGIKTSTGVAGQQPLRFFTADQERMRLYANGNLLIGDGALTTAIQAVHVYNGNLLIDGSGNTGNLLLGNGLGNGYSQWGIEYLVPNTGVHPGGMNFWKPWNSIDGNGGNGFGNYFLFLRNDGKIGVGTECVPSDAKMAVNGKLYAREVEIQTNTWCDSIFDPTYRLPSFDELRAYIDIEKHLPGLPSETQVINRGSMGVMEMNLMLLQKVEEMHLYILELESRLKNVEASTKPSKKVNKQ